MLLLLKLVLGYLPNSYKREFIFAFILLLLSGIAEIISISAILPFLTLLDDSSIENISNDFLLDLFPFNLFNQDNLFLLAIIFVLAIAFSGIVRLFSIWCNSFFSAKVGSFLSNYMFRGYLSKDYEFHVNQNTNKIILALTQHINGTVRALFYLLQFLSGIIISTFIITYLIFLNPNLTIISLFIFGSYYLIIASTFKLKLVNNSKSIVDIGQTQMKLVRESFGSIRDVLINGYGNYYADIYRANDKVMRVKQASNIFISIFPRYSLEAIAIIAFTILGISFDRSDFGKIAMLGSLAFAAQRLLPALQSIYSAWAMLKNFYADILEVKESIVNVEINKINYKEDLKIKSFYNFKKIELQNISYKYKNSKNEIFNSCNFKINKGETIAFIGKTGSGKSTLVDLIMGLLHPSSGKILIDDYEIYSEDSISNLFSWRKCISHVPQEVFLKNDSIYSNIVENNKRLIKKDCPKFLLAIETSQIKEFLYTLDYGIDTFVGEKGVKLSGGQKQRIGVARALIKEKPILVLDESTSALDEKTEQMMLDSIKLNYPDLTILMITHRKSNLKYCDRKVFIEKGKINEI